jgi:coenzyme Q-binding protein COQ10
MFPLPSLTLNDRYSQAQLYSLVSDVPSYSSFIPFCQSSRVLAGRPEDKGKDGERRSVDWSPDDKPFDLEAELMVGFGGLEEVYTSRVVGKPFESVTVSHQPYWYLFWKIKRLIGLGHSS